MSRGFNSIVRRMNTNCGPSLMIPRRPITIANSDRYPSSPSGIWGDIRDRELGISEIDSLGDYQSANMHVFGPDHNQEISPDMTLGVWNGHMRFLTPSAETMPRDWIDWRPNISAVFNYDWNFWCDELNGDHTLHTVFLWIHVGSAKTTSESQRIMRPTPLQTWWDMSASTCMHLEEIPNLGTVRGGNTGRPGISMAPIFHITELTRRRTIGRARRVAARLKLQKSLEATSCRTALINGESRWFN